MLLLTERSLTTFLFSQIISDCAYANYKATIFKIAS
jgi:hypothetical protein